MYEHYENYDRYIPDVMLKKHRKHEEYLSDKYKGMTHQEIYQSKLGTAETASSGPSTPASPGSSCATSTGSPTASTPRTRWSCGPAWPGGARSIPSTPTPP